MVEPLGIALASRLVVFVVGAVAMHLVPDNPRFRPAAYFAEPWLEIWYRWDASWYTAIAFRGYQASGPDAPSQAFWPLLPLLEWLVHWPVLWWLTPNNEGAAVAWAGLVVVTTAFAAACVVLYRLAWTEYSRDTARRAVTLLAFAPGAVYYTAVYPSGLILLGTVGCFYALRRGRWALAGAAGAWAALSNVPGCLLVLPFAWEYLRQRRRLGWDALWGLLIPAGPAVWLAYLWWKVGDPLAPVHAASRYWPHYVAWPWETLWKGLVLGPNVVVEHPMVLLNAVAAVVAITACFWAIAVRQTAWGIWGLAVMALYLSVPAKEPLEGIIRYGLKITPVWAMLALVTRNPMAERVTMLLFAALLGLLTTMYVNGYWVA